MARLLPAAVLLLAWPALAQTATENTSRTLPETNAPAPQPEPQTEPNAPESHTQTEHATPEHAEAAEEEEPAAVLALGGSTGWPFTGGAAAFGSDTSIKFTVIKHWLVLEPGATSLFTHTSTEWDIDWVFKKPWTLSPTIEAMAGLAPEYANTRSHGVYTNTINAEIVGDFLFWTSPRHRFGFYAEPAYAIDLRQDHGQSIGITAGLLVGIPHRRHAKP